MVGPRLTRTAPRASSGGTPMAASTWEGWTLPDEQAAPEDTAMPSRSKRDDGGLGLDAGDREQRRVGQPLGLRAEHDRGPAMRA